MIESSSIPDALGARTRTANSVQPFSRSVLDGHPSAAAPPPPPPPACSSKCCRSERITRRRDRSRRCQRSPGAIHVESARANSSARCQVCRPAARPMLTAPTAARGRSGHVGRIRSPAKRNRTRGTRVRRFRAREASHEADGDASTLAVHHHPPPPYPGGIGGRPARLQRDGGRGRRRRGGAPV